MKFYESIKFGGRGWNLDNIYIRTPWFFISDSIHLHNLLFATKSDYDSGKKHIKFIADSIIFNMHANL